MTLKLCDQTDKPSKVIPFERKPDKFETAMLELIELNRQGKITHFVGIWDTTDSREMKKSWWGESCCMCLGMATRMVEEINRWINGEVEE